MPATAQRKTSKESQKPSFLSGDWQDLFIAIDPLAEWDNRFAAWRENIQVFRKAEERHFLPSPDNFLSLHVHRGALGSLISDGESLAIQLIREHLDTKERLEFVNLCLENLQSTLDTWHSTAKNDPDFVSASKV